MRDYRGVLGENIRYYRRKNSMSQEAVALAAGMSPQHLGDIERAGENPTLDTVSRIAGALGIELWRLLMDRSEEYRDIVADRLMFRRLYRYYAALPDGAKAGFMEMLCQLEKFSAAREVGDAEE